MHDTRDRTSRRPRGFLLFPVLVAIGGLVLLGAEGLLRAKLELVAANRFLAKQQALALAEGRLDEIVTAIAADPVTASQWTSCPPPAAAPLGTTTCTMGPLGTPFVDGPGGVIKQEVQIQVSGLVPDALNPQGQQTVEAVVAVPVGALFQWAGYGDGGLATFGSVGRIDIDSYDSSLGPYTPPSGPSVGATIQVGNASHGCGAILLWNARLFGDAFVAPGCDPLSPSVIQTFMGGEIYGIRGNAPVPTLPAVRVPAGSPQGTPLVSCPGGSLSVDVASFPYSAITLAEPCAITLTGNGTVALDDFYFNHPSSRLTVNGNIQLTTGRFWLATGTTVLGANASVAVYANGEVVTNGEINGTGSLGRPKDFALYVLESGLMNPPPMLRGKFYGTVYAPSTPVHLLGELPGPGNEVFGSLVGGRGQLIVDHNAKLHQDLSLKNEGAVVSPTNPIRRRSWRIVAP